MLCELSPQSSTCSSNNSQQMLVSQTSNTQLEIFKKPLQPPLRKKKKVLDEETYVHKLGKIIERDFFPDLENLKDKVEFLEAHQNNDLERLQQLQLKYSTGSSRRLQTPASVLDSPETFDTPDHNRPTKKKLGTEEVNQKNDDDTHSIAGSSVSSTTSKKLSLDEFLARNTSEDDESFDQIMEDSRQAYMHKKSWMFTVEEPHNAEHAPDLTMKALPSSIYEALEQEKMEQEKPRVIENWKYKTFNSIMYVPEEHHVSRARELELARAAPREVVHNNTRFDDNPFDKAINQATVMEATATQAIKKEGRIGVDGRELSKSTPRIRGYSFIGDASPAPGVDESPLMTWGEVEGTPFQLDRSATPLVHSSSAPSYSIPKTSHRDVLALQLNEKANLAQRDKKSKALSAARSSLCSPLVSGGRGAGGGSERWATERLAKMSPAARRLLSTGLGVRQGTDRSLRSSYTPSPAKGAAAASSVRSSLRSSYGGLTPSPVPGTSSRKVRASPSLRSPAIPSVVTPKSKRSSGCSQGLTDGLLQLPKRNSSSAKAPGQGQGSRACAADFF